MRFSTITLALSLAFTTFAAPTAFGIEEREPKKSSKASSTAVAAAAATTAASASTGAAGAVLTAQDYSAFQVSDGVGGSALAEVNAKFPVCSFALSWFSDLDPFPSLSSNPLLFSHPLLESSLPDRN